MDEPVGEPAVAPKEDSTVGLARDEAAFGEDEGVDVPADGKTAAEEDAACEAEVAGEDDAGAIEESCDEACEEA